MLETSHDSSLGRSIQFYDGWLKVSCKLCWEILCNIPSTQVQDPQKQAVLAALAAYKSIQIWQIVLLPFSSVPKVPVFGLAHVHRPDTPHTWIPRVRDIWLGAQWRRWRGGAGDLCRSDANGTGLAAPRIFNTGIQAYLRPRTNLAHLWTLEWCAAEPGSDKSFRDHVQQVFHHHGDANFLLLGRYPESLSGCQSHPYSPGRRWLVAICEQGEGGSQMFDEDVDSIMLETPHMFSDGSCRRVF